MNRSYKLVGAFIGTALLTACGGASDGVAPSAPTVEAPGSQARAAQKPAGSGAVEFAYALDGNSIYEYAINAASGALTQVDGSPYILEQYANKANARNLAIDPKGTFLYVTDVEYGRVFAFTINPSSGALTEVYGSPYSSQGSQPIGVAVADSAFVYVADNYVEANDVAAFTINPSSGALTPVYGSPFAAGDGPTDVAVAPKNKFLYVTNGGGNVSAYAINATTGALTQIAGSPFAAGPAPVGVAVDVKGRFLYVTNYTSNYGPGSVSAYAINPTTGVLTQVNGSPFAAGNGPNAVAVDHDGKFLYVANGGPSYSTGSVSAYAINGSNGALTQIAGSPFAAGTGPDGVAFAHHGKFLYVTNGGSGNVSAYAINATTGALAQISGSPFAGGASDIATCRVTAGTCKGRSL